MTVSGAKSEPCQMSWPRLSGGCCLYLMFIQFAYLSIPILPSFLQFSTHCLSIFANFLTVVNLRQPHCCHPVSTIVLTANESQHQTPEMQVLGFSI